DKRIADNEQRHFPEAFRHHAAFLPQSRRRAAPRRLLQIIMPVEVVPDKRHEQLTRFDLPRVSRYPLYPKRRIASFPYSAAHVGNLLDRTFNQCMIPLIAS